MEYELRAQCPATCDYGNDEDNMLKQRCAREHGHPGRHSASITWDNLCYTQNRNYSGIFCRLEAGHDGPHESKLVWLS